MKIFLLTLFPKIFSGVFSESIIKKAQEKKLLEIHEINLRNYAKDRHKTVDDKPFGGGGGMVLKVDVAVEALESIQPKPYTILLSASGKKYTQKIAQSLFKKESLAIICGHYEGVDARVEKYANIILSIGDFVLTGGEIAAMAIVDSVTRLLPGVIKKESLDFESFQPTTSYPLPATVLEYPHYTRPKEFRGLKVPQVLLSGNHAKIAKWRNNQAIKRTKKYRPDLL